MKVGLIKAGRPVGSDRADAPYVAALNPICDYVETFQQALRNQWTMRPPNLTPKFSTLSSWELPTFEPTQQPVVTLPESPHLTQRTDQLPADSTIRYLTQRPNRLTADSTTRPVSHSAIPRYHKVPAGQFCRMFRDSAKPRSRDSADPRFCETARRPPCKKARSRLRTRNKMLASPTWFRLSHIAATPPASNLLMESQNQYIYC